MDARLPDRIGRFEVLSLLGRGAMGVVYKARDPHLGRFVAIKVIRAELISGVEQASYRARFHDEARMAALCAHPGIVTLHEFNLAEGLPHLVLEYVDGLPLSRILAAGRRLCLAEIRHIALLALDALAHIHAVGIVHCDIKPANLLLTGAARLKIADFGISRPREQDPAGISLLIGTPNYMSPEQCRGDPVDPRSDLFSLGAVLYELITLERPFQGLSYTDTVFKLINQPHHALAVLRADLPSGLAALIDQALAKSPAARFPDAQSFASALREIPITDDAAAGLLTRFGAEGFTRFAYEAAGFCAADEREETVRLRPLPEASPEAWAAASAAPLPEPAWAAASAAGEPAKPRRSLLARFDRIGAQWRRWAAPRTLLPATGALRPREKE
ncbi:serine/threonine-protein kinase [Acidisoma sp. C75]